MAITPPAVKHWWSEPIERTEALWVGIALLWAMIMFFMMPYWHLVGNQNLANTAFRVNPDAYAAKVEAFVQKYKVGEQGKTNIPVVAPPAGSDVYILARLWEWSPILQLEKGKSYRLHLSSMDWLHGFSLQPVNINIQVHPGYEMVINVTPTSSGEFGLVCNEYCGVGHHTMLGKVIVK